MDTKERNEDFTRRKRHARRLAMDSMRGAGSRTNVAKVLGVAMSTVSHESTSRPNQILDAFFRMFLDLSECPDTTARAIVEAVNEALEIREIQQAETPTLVERGLYLLEHEDVLDSYEDIATKRGSTAHAAALRDHGYAALELAAIHEELLARRIDLLALYRERAA